MSRKGDIFRGCKKYMIKLVELGEQSAELNASELKWFNKQIESLQNNLTPE